MKEKLHLFMVLSKYLMYGLAFMIFSSSIVFAQELEIRGKVSDEENTPLPRVNVSIKGTTNGTVTDTDGDYSLTADNDAVLVFSFIGYESQEVNVGNKSVINITLKSDLTQLEEVIVTGYRTQARGTVTGSVASVSSEEFDYP